jgi:hypothetical protein
VIYFVVLNKSIMEIKSNRDFLIYIDLSKKIFTQYSQGVLHKKGFESEGEGGIEITYYLLFIIHYPT